MFSNQPFDPNNYDYDLVQKQIERQRELTKTLADARMQNGQMVSGWYVPGAKSSLYSSILQNILGGYVNYKTDQNEQENQTNSQAALRAWLEGKPQPKTTPAPTVEQPQQPAGGEGPVAQPYTTTPTGQVEIRELAPLSPANAGGQVLRNTLANTRPPAIENRGVAPSGQGEVPAGVVNLEIPPSTYGQPVNEQQPQSAAPVVQPPQVTPVSDADRIAWLQRGMKTGPLGKAIAAAQFKQMFEGKPELQFHKGTNGDYVFDPRTGASKQLPGSSESRKVKSTFGTNDGQFVIYEDGTIARATTADGKPIESDEQGKQNSKNLAQQDSYNKIINNIDNTLNKINAVVSNPGKLSDATGVYGKFGRWVNDKTGLSTNASEVQAEIESLKSNFFIAGLDQLRQADGSLGLGAMSDRESMEIRNQIAAIDVTKQSKAEVMRQLGVAAERLAEIRQRIISAAEVRGYQYGGQQTAPSVGVGNPSAVSGYKQRYNGPQ